MPQSWDNPNFFERWQESRRQHRRERSQAERASQVDLWEEHRQNVQIQERLMEQARENLERRWREEMMGVAFPPLQINSPELPEMTVTPGAVTSLPEAADQTEVSSIQTPWYTTYSESTPVDNRWYFPGEFQGITRTATGKGQGVKTEQRFGKLLPGYATCTKCYTAMNITKVVCRNYRGRNELMYIVDALVELDATWDNSSKIQQWLHYIQCCRQHVKFDGEQTLMQELFEQEPFKSRTTL